MAPYHFSTPPASLSAHDRWLWQARITAAEGIVQMEAGVPAATVETLALLERYVQGELTLEEVVAVQQRRLGHTSS